MASRGDKLRERREVQEREEFEAPMSETRMELGAVKLTLENVARDAADAREEFSRFQLERVRMNAKHGEEVKARERKIDELIAATALMRTELDAAKKIIRIIKLSLIGALFVLARSGYDVAGIIANLLSGGAIAP